MHAFVVTMHGGTACKMGVYNLSRELTIATQSLRATQVGWALKPMQTCIDWV